MDTHSPRLARPRPRSAERQARVAPQARCRLFHLEAAEGAARHTNIARCTISCCDLTHCLTHSKRSASTGNSGSSARASRRMRSSQISARSSAISRTPEKTKRAFAHACSRNRRSSLSNRLSTAQGGAFTYDTSDNKRRRAGLGLDSRDGTPTVTDGGRRGLFDLKWIIPLRNSASA